MSDETDITPDDEIETADAEYQARADELAEAEAIEVNNRRWVVALARVLEAAKLDDAAIVDVEIREALTGVTVTACERLMRVLKSDVESG